jgi:ATP-dependent Clp protease ATP-binding subunit ClpA
MLKALEPDLKAHFRPEFLNRIDDIIVFNPLGENVVKQIVEVLLQNVVKRLEERNIKVSFSDNLKKHLMEVGYDREFGARPMKRAITNVIMNQLSTKILS